MRRPRLPVCLVFLVLMGCGGGSIPHLLTTTVHRNEEQGIDYSSTGTWRLELGLDGATGLATYTARATDVAGSDVHTTDEAFSYDVEAHREGDVLTLALTPHEGAPPTADAVTLRCTPWTESERTRDGFGALLGPAWACALPEDRTFALGRVAIEHVPREGRAFVLLSETSQLVILEQVSQSGRTLELQSAPPRR